MFDLLFSKQIFSYTLNLAKGLDCTDVSKNFMFEPTKSSNLILNLCFKDL